jgi:predicted TIM-barrel fold metal-dependent hydrolase
MRADVHTHMWSGSGVPEFLRRYAASRGGESSVESGTERLLASMDATGIEIAVAVALVPTPDLDDSAVEAINRYVTTQTALAPERLLPFCAVNPRSPDPVATLRREIEEFGARGLKLHGAMQAINVDDRLLWPIYQTMQDRGLPVLFHSGDIGVLPTKDRYTQASRFDEIACDFPELPMVLGHAGRVDFTTVAGLLRKHPHVYLDISSVIGRDRASRTYPMRRLLEIVKSWAGTTDNVLFGSDFPLYSQEVTLAVLNELAEQLEMPAAPPSPVTVDDIAAVRDTNAAKFLADCNLI